jgi:hypothetical protein
VASFPPEHGQPATKIRYLVKQIFQELTLSPAHAMRVYSWAPDDELRPEAAKVAHWLTRLVELLSIEEQGS